jgi:TetR/AcrR family transcriptional repressor of nem operon
MRKSEATRLEILQKSFELIYAKGYQNTSIDDILATTRLTKGAFYYHFKSKDEMGLAIINELMKPVLNRSLIQPLMNASDPSKAIYDMMYGLLMENPFLRVEYGCPAANFSQEMTPWNADFSLALNEVTDSWKKALSKVIEQGKKSGHFRNDVPARQVTLFILTGYWGVRNLGRLENSKKTYLLYLKELKSYLASLR